MAGKKNTRGGARPGAGRKKVEDPKKQLQIYIPQSYLDSIGGDQEAKKIAVASIKRKAEKIN